MASQKPRAIANPTPDRCRPDPRGGERLEKESRRAWDKPGPGSRTAISTASPWRPSVHWTSTAAGYA